ncbi:MAG: hypothetical protein QMC36_02260, partial [Patescibacteria group bacterium]
ASFDIKDNEGKFEDSLKSEAEGKIGDLKKVLENADASRESLEEATKSLQDVMMKIGQEIYSKAQAAGDDGVRVKENVNETKSDDAVDGEVEEK